jgi:uncharacterized protein with NRDE domain
MCIAIVTTAHPDYPLILLNNRDVCFKLFPFANLNTKVVPKEYLHRPTDPAGWWPPPDSHILGGRDLQRAEHGTWLGITKQGRLACLTNFREQTATFVEGSRSRGAIVNAYLRTPCESTETSSDIAHKLIEEGLAGVGGFSLLFGRLRKPSWRIGEISEKKSKWEGLAIVSNRSEHINDVKWLCQQAGETHALSNAHYGDMTWPKVVDAENLVAKGVLESSAKKEGTDELITRLLGVLTLDTLPRQRNGEEWNTYLGQLRNSIFVPAIGKDKERLELARNSPLPNGQSNVSATVLHDIATSGVYGTQKQTIVLVDWNGKMTYYERTLFDVGGNPVAKGDGDVRFEFVVEGW